MTLHDFVFTLFREGEFTCYAAQKKGTTVFPVEDPPTWVQFFSLNPLYEDIDLTGKAEPGRGRRADVNVAAHRNFLIEIDSIPLDEQKKYVDSLLVPWSTMVYSGGKSYHFIIALEEEVSAEEYAHLAKWLLAIVDKADQSVKNPSRFSRFPGVVRKEKGVEQTFVEGRGRISLETFKNWLSIRPELEPKASIDFVHPALDEIEPRQRGCLWPTTYQFLREEAPPGFRNRYLFMAACDFHEQNYPLEEALTRLGKVSTLDTAEFEETVKSAYARQPKYGVRTWGMRFIQKVS